MKNLLILCTGNACRSQITEGYFRALRGDEFLVCSAGIEAHGLNPTAVAVVRETGVDISDHRSEVVTDAMIQWADTVITVCGNAREACPVLPAGVAETHWPISDPAAVKGDNAVVLAAFRSVREDIRARVEQFGLGTETLAPDASC